MVNKRLQVSMLPLVSSSFFTSLLPIGLLWGTAKITAMKWTTSTVKENFVCFGYAIIPLDLAGHLAHNFFHMLTEGKAVWFNTMTLFGPQVSGDVSLASVGTVQFLQYLTIIVGLFGSGYTVYRIGNKASWKQLLPYYSLMIILALINIYLFTLPMTHRVQVDKHANRNKTEHSGVMSRG